LASPWRRRGESGGGIIPACSLRIIFSATSAFCAARATSNAASDRPPVFLVSLWQPTQYRRIKALSSADDWAGVDVFAALCGCRGAWGATGSGRAGVAAGFWANPTLAVRPSHIRPMTRIRELALFILGFRRL
jgi:hypothetical protein